MPKHYNKKRIRKVKSNALPDESNRVQENTMTPDTDSNNPQTQQGNAHTTSGFKTKEALLDIAQEMWNVVRDLIKNKTGFSQSSDKEKLEFFADKLNYKEFLDEFPVVARYMICLGQYSKKAFGRLLDKVRIAHNNMPPPHQRPKGYAEDEWVKRQADYVRFLWEAYQPPHYDRSQGAAIWQDAYEKLKGEFDDFRLSYDQAEKTVKSNKKKFAIENTKDLITVLKDSDSGLTNADKKEILDILKQRLKPRRIKNIMKEILEKVPLIPAVCEGIGKGETDADTTDQPRQTIKMTEYVDDTRIDEVPEYYLRQDDLDDKYKQKA